MLFLQRIIFSMDRTPSTDYSDLLSKKYLWCEMIVKIVYFHKEFSMKWDTSYFWLVNIHKDSSWIDTDQSEFEAQYRWSW